jgi:hypothetical protein
MIAQHNVSMATAEFDNEPACHAAVLGIVKDFKRKYADALAVADTDAKLNRMPNPSFFSYHCAKKG